MTVAGKSWLDHYNEEPLKLRWKLFAILLGMVGGWMLWLILEWYYERKQRKKSICTHSF